MKIEQIQPAVISTDGTYSEDTLVRVTAVDADSPTCATIPNFTGTVNIAEVQGVDGNTIYSQPGGCLSWVGGQCVSPSLNIQEQSKVEFIARSLAGPSIQGIVEPQPAEIKTTNYPVCQVRNLIIPQWIITGNGNEIDPVHSGGGVFDWVQTQARDLFSRATLDPDLNVVLAAVSTYTVEALGPNVTGKIKSWSRSNQSAIVLNPFFDEHRRNSGANPNCNTIVNKAFENTLLHEGRHAYQASQTVVAGNDEDFDFLVNNVGIFPFTILKYSQDFRDVCDENTGRVFPWRYNGPGIPDAWDAPAPGQAGVWHAIEKDAWNFAAAH